MALSLRLRNNNHNTVRQGTTIAAPPPLTDPGHRVQTGLGQVVEVMEAQNGQENETNRIEQELIFLENE